MVSYLHEVSEGENIVIKGQLLESDAKKLRLFLTMSHATTHVELATMETLLLHMDMIRHKASPFLPHTLSLVENIQTAHNKLEKPKNAGKPISLKRI
jgi:acyl-CoA thioester hydrolase